MAIKKTTSDYAEEILQKFKLTLVGEYNGGDNPVKVTCENNHEGEYLAKRITEGRYLCGQCKTPGFGILTKRKNNRKTPEEFNKEILDLYGLLVISQYTGSKEHVKVLCPQGHENTRIASNLLLRGMTCDTCNTKVTKSAALTAIDKIFKTSEEYACEILKKFGLTVISDYKGAHQDVDVLCPRGHVNTRTATNLLQRGLQCRTCITGIENIERITWSVKNIEYLRFLIEQLKTTEEIAQEFNTSIDVINSACQKYNISKPRERFTLPKLQVVLDFQKRTLVSPVLSTTTRDYIDIMCDKGHVANQLVSNVLSNTGCPQCWNESKVSKMETNLREYIESIYKGELQYNDRTIVTPQELDIVLPQLKLAFEFNGTYWHSDVKVDKHYHSNKTAKALHQGYQLIHIHEHQWSTKQDIVKSRIASLLGQNTKVGARKCVIKAVDWHTAKIFLGQTHLQGAGSPTSINLALYYQDEIVAIMTFGKPRYTKDCEYELIRYSQKLNHNVIGGASKLLNYFENEYLPDDIVSYANRDYSKGTLYENLGFKLSHISEPNYNYFKKEEKLSRYQTQKAKLEALLPEYWDPKLTESEIMQNAGYLKVYDSGNLVYKKTY